MGVLNLNVHSFSSSAHTVLKLTKDSETRLTNDLKDVRNKTAELEKQISRLAETLSSKHEFLHYYEI